MRSSDQGTLTAEVDFLDQFYCLSCPLETFVQTADSSTRKLEPVFYFRVIECKQKDVPPLQAAGENMTKLELLNVFLNDRLTAAAEEIFRAVKDTVLEYQSEILRSKEENERLKRLLNVAVQRLLLQSGEEQPLGQDVIKIHCLRLFIAMLHLL